MIGLNAVDKLEPKVAKILATQALATEGSLVDLVEQLDGDESLAALAETTQTLVSKVRKIRKRLDARAIQSA